MSAPGPEKSTEYQSTGKLDDVFELVGVPVRPKKRPRELDSDDSDKGDRACISEAQWLSYNDSGNMDSFVVSEDDSEPVRPPCRRKRRLQVLDSHDDLNDGSASISEAYLPSYNDSGNMDSFVVSEDDSEPVRPPCRRKRLQVLDSHNDLDGNGSACISKAHLPLFDHHPNTSSASNHSSIVDEPLNESDEDMDDEVDDNIQNEYEDQDYLAGSDNSDEAIPEQMLAPSSIDIIGTVNLDGTFARILRAVIEGLVSWARGCVLRDTRDEFRPVTLGYWYLLRSASVEFLASLFVRGVPEQVQDLFQKKEWSSEDLLSLPAAEDDGRQGIYANIAIGHIDVLNEAGCDVYVGSSICLKDRVKDHLSIARSYTNKPLPKAHANSLHYRQICREGVQSNFRKLAAFDVSIEHGYLMLLEGIFMVLFNTYQLFRHTKGAPKAIRQTAEIGNPLGPYLCGRCGNYRNKYKTLPGKAFLDKMDEQLLAGIPNAHEG
ncbi:hypothetical protein AnigIFM63309_004039 [Aspergillus niger]|nr:hypothetical protein AnigIFM63309_004039 [Aspergillus niger]